MKSEPNDLLKAIRTLRPEAEFSFSDGDYSTIKWDKLEGEAPSEKEIQKTILEIKAQEQAEAAAKEAARQALLDKLGITAEEAQLLLGGK